MFLKRLARAVFTSASTLPGSILIRPSAYICLLGALVVRRGVAAGAQRQAASATRKVYSVFSTVFCLSCCLLLV